MGKLQRSRGADFEREICSQLSTEFNRKVQRKLGQARDGGDDIEIGPFIIECKRRRSIAVYAWLDQVLKAADSKESAIQHLTPCVIARADAEDSIVILRLIDFIPLMRGELIGNGPT